MMYGFVVAIGVVVLQLASCCPVQEGLSVDRMNQLLNDAKQRNGNGTMHLLGHGRGPGTLGFPIAEWPPNTEVIRAPEGGTLLIPCNNSHNANKTQVSHIAIPPAFTYNGRQIPVPTVKNYRKSFSELNYCCNCTLKFNPGEYSLNRSWYVPEYDPLSGAFSIVLFNFTYAHTGLYECLHSNGSQLVVTQRYWISATLFRHEVFSPPMQNLTVRHGYKAEMICPVRFTFLPGYLATRFLWRKGEDLLMAESSRR
ncbi:uncharacterized protein LOC129588971 [Paramacrobiotus metropolitanus]|uniref:uncharacterized protein LOC129588971 n=1 Tax=Paramacrobiotus metropolitanus TaxID=2943436 RepID=UPI0024457BAC|nr:uncharacterized protein LOC129588971 [Paramacrobiotus metropolitanus]